MLQAEIRGKMSSKQENGEDLLTSNVFSFFKYAKRSLYLKRFLNGLGFDISNESLESAEFRFWPRYNDNTEPDLVIIAGDYYILFEAKHLSSFGDATEDRKCQILRELEGGIDEAASFGKIFFYVAITSHHNNPQYLFTDFSDEERALIKWTNWQTVAQLLLEALEAQPAAPDSLFARDLYDLLDKKKLRGFLPFSRLKSPISTPPQPIFFSAKTAHFRGCFIGFESALENGTVQKVPPRSLFYRRVLFVGFPLFVPEPQPKQILLGRTV